jgi:hypothetical protein
MFVVVAFSSFFPLLGVFYYANAGWWLQINTSSEKYSHARSLTWAAGFALCFYQIYKAAVALN